MTYYKQSRRNIHHFLNIESNIHLDERVCVGVSMDAEQEEPFSLLIITVVGVQHLGEGLYLIAMEDVVMINEIKFWLWIITFFISAIISLGSLLLMVFILQVNRRDRGLIWVRKKHFIKENTWSQENVLSEKGLGATEGWFKDPKYVGILCLTRS